MKRILHLVLVKNITFKSSYNWFKDWFTTLIDPHFDSVLATALTIHFFTPLFFFCNWLLHRWNGFYTWSQPKISLLSPLITDPFLVFALLALGQWGERELMSKKFMYAIQYTQPLFSKSEDSKCNWITTLMWLKVEMEEIKLLAPLQASKS